MRRTHILLDLSYFSPTHAVHKMVLIWSPEPSHHTNDHTDTIRIIRSDAIPDYYHSQKSQIAHAHTHTTHTYSHRSNTCEPPPFQQMRRILFCIVGDQSCCCFFFVRPAQLPKCCLAAHPQLCHPA